MPRKKPRSSKVKKQRSISSRGKKLLTASARKQARKAKIVKTTKLAKIDKLSADNRDVNTLRRALRELRDLGLYKSSRDLRKIKKNDTRALNVVLKFKDLLAGNAKLVQMPTRAEARKHVGKRVVGKMVIEPTQPKTKTRVSGKRIISVRKARDGEIYTLGIPGKRGDIDRMLDEVNDDKDLQQKISDGWRLGFKYFGNYSYSFFDSMTQLRKYLEHYPKLTVDIGSFNAVELVLVSPQFKRPDYRGKEKAKASLRTDKTGRSIFSYKHTKQRRKKK